VERLLQALAGWFSDRGFADGMLAIVMVLCGLWIYKIHQGRLDDLQREIDRLAQENREHRDRFARILERNPLTRLEDHTRQKPEDGI